jgi:hypothetical protein
VYDDTGTELHAVVTPHGGGKATKGKKRGKKAAQQRSAMSPSATVILAVESSLNTRAERVTGQRALVRTAQQLSTLRDDAEAAAQRAQRLREVYIALARDTEK